jgi:hypothetical protein
MEVSLMSKKRIAFWSYDLFPYMLWSEIEKINNDNTVTVKGYGGSKFRPIFVLKEERANVLIKGLSEMTNCRKMMMKMFDERVSDVIDEYTSGEDK